MIECDELSLAIWQVYNHSESCHDETGCKIVVVVIPKEGLAGSSPAKSYFDITLVFNQCSLYHTSVIPKKAWLGRCQPGRI